MRFPLASVFFIIASFIFFAIFAVSSLLITEVGDALDAIDDDLGGDYPYIVQLLPTAFGIIAAIFFVVGILLIFVLDSLADEPEMYWRER